MISPEINCFKNISDTHLTKTYKEACIIRDQRLEDLDKEIKRLKATILPSHSELPKLLKYYDTPVRVTVSFGRALEIKKLYEKTHHVFAHAQAAGLVVLTYAFKQLAKQRMDVHDLHLFNYLREPNFTGSLTIEIVPNRCNKGSYSDHDPYLRKEALSVDAYFPNTQRNESALDFLACNRSVCDLETSFCDLPSQLNDNNKVDQLIELAKKVQKQAECGAYYVICIPKKDTKNIAYRAHVGGEPCDCFPRETDVDVITRLNQNILNENDICEEDEKTGYDREIPQFRLLTSMLKPGQGILIFPITPFSKQFRKELKSTIAKILHDSGQQKTKI